MLPDLAERPAVTDIGVHRHLRGCPDCQAKLVQFRSLRHLMADLPLPAPPGAPPPGSPTRPLAGARPDAGNRTRAMVAEAGPVAPAAMAGLLAGAVVAGLVAGLAANRVLARRR
jgi:hypothetical protein